MGKRPYFLLQSVEKAFRVIEALSNKELTSLGELTSALDMTKPNVHRLLLTLKHMSYVYFDPQTRRYGLSYKLFSLGCKIPSRNAIVELARESMENLARLSRETINLGIFADDKVLYLEKIISPESLRIDQPIGNYDPCYCTSLGKVLLAWLDEDVLQQYLERQVPLKSLTKNTIIEPDKLINLLQNVRKQGYALDRAEVLEGVCCIGAPVFNLQREVIAAVSISGPKVRMTQKRLDELRPHLLKCTSEITEKM